MQYYSRSNIFLAEILIDRLRQASSQYTDGSLVNPKLIVSLQHIRFIRDAKKKPTANQIRAIFLLSIIWFFSPPIFYGYCILMMTIIFYTIFFFFVFKIIFTFDILLFSFPILNILYILILHTSLHTRFLMETILCE